MDTPATLRKHPFSLALSAETRQPSTSVGSISPPRAWPSTTNDNEVMLYRKEGRDRKTNCHILHITPPVFCTKAKIAKGGYLWDTTVYVCTHIMYIWENLNNNNIRSKIQISTSYVVSSSIRLAPMNVIQEQWGKPRDLQNLSIRPVASIINTQFQDSSFGLRRLKMIVDIPVTCTAI